MDIGGRRDETPRLLAEGYDFLTNRTRGLGRRWFETRLMGRRAVLIGGGDAPEVLYAPDRFTRVGALPPTSLRLLQGKSVNQLDGERHRTRKAEFLRLLGPAAQAVLADRFRTTLKARLVDGRRVVLLETAEAALCEAACAWAGVPERDARTLARRTREFSGMVGEAGRADPRLLRALALRRRNEAWAEGLIRRARRRRPDIAPGSPLADVAAWTGKGKPLPAKVTAIELINLLRPTVAVARYVVFAADALRLHPEWRSRVLNDDAAAEAFALEVRRLYPFFPGVGGRVLQPFEWAGRSFRRGEWVLADLHGANHDPERWSDPDTFDPDRFLAGGEPAAKVAAQGAGDASSSHRCPGEGLTIALLAAAVRVLAGLDWRLPPQDLRIPLWRMPTQPESGLILDVGSSPATSPPPRPRSPPRLPALGLSATLFGMGLLFLAAPRSASRVFGLPREGRDLPYVRALAFRDLSFAAALALAARGRGAALASTAAAFALVPALDLALVLRRRGLKSLPSAALHLASGMALASLALVSAASTRPAPPPGGRYLRRLPRRD